MTADAISFSRIGRDGLAAADSRDSVYFRPAVAKAVASGMQPKLYVGGYLGHHARIGSILIIMTIDGVVKAAGFRRVDEESRLNVDN